MQVALAAVFLADLRDHQPLIDQLAQHPVERLLGDLKDIQQPRHSDPWPALDKVDRPVMGAPEPAITQHRIRIAGEIAIGKEQQLDALPKLLIRQIQHLVGPSDARWWRRS